MDTIIDELKVKVATNFASLQATNELDTTDEILDVAAPILPCPMQNMMDESFELASTHTNGC